MAILYCGCNAALGIPCIHATSHYTGLHVKFETSVKRQFHRERTVFINDGLIRLCKVVGRDTQPRRFCKQHTAESDIEKGFAEVRIETFGAGLTNKFAR